MIHTVGTTRHLGEDITHLPTGIRSRIRVRTRLERVQECLDLALLPLEFLDRHFNFIQEYKCRGTQGTRS